MEFRGLKYISIKICGLLLFVNFQQLGAFTVQKQTHKVTLGTTQSSRSFVRSSVWHKSRYFCTNKQKVSTRSDSTKEKRKNTGENLYVLEKSKEGLSRRHLLILSSSFATLGAMTSTTSSYAASTIGVDDSVTAAGPYAESVLKGIIKPPLDLRNYGYYILKNGLKVLVCSDPSSTSAAAAIDVHVGATSDPIDVPGMAHFNEHMLFLGTEKYPKEDSFTSFLSTNGGFSNAFTDSENTVYYFDMNAEPNLREGLDRFGSFFTSPLFTSSATGRELNAIESENAKNLQSDVFRIYQIEKSRANIRHPYSKFFTGNKQTLLDDTERKGINLRNELIKFSKTYYSANQMTVALVGPQSLEVLKSYVFDAFEGVPNLEVSKPEVAWNSVIPPFVQTTNNGESFSSNNDSSLIPAQGSIVEIVPVQDLRQVTITFPIVYSSEEEKMSFLLDKPDIYVAHLIGHEGPGSLLSYLKAQGWANGLGASVNAELSDFQTFDVTVELTEKGLLALDDIVGAVFSYLRMLNDNPIPKYIFDEVLNLSELEWRFLTQGNNPASYVQSLAESMQKYDPKLVIAGPRRLALNDVLSSAPRSSFQSNAAFESCFIATKGLLSYLIVDNMFLTVLSKTFEGKTSLSEKWYGTAYNAKPIPKASLTKWKQSPRLGELAYPAPNVYIPTESGLRVKIPLSDKSLKKNELQKSLKERLKSVAPPALLRDDNRWTVYFKQDDRFGEPKAYTIFELLTSNVYSSAKNAVLAQLYQTCTEDRLDESTYDARLAGLFYNIQILPRGIRLTFGGYNEKLAGFAKTVAETLSKNIGSILPPNEGEFERYKDNIRRGLAAFDVSQPYSHAIYYSTLALQPQKFQYSNADMREALKMVTLSDLRCYVETLWSSGKGEALIQGNIDRKEATQLVEAIDSAFNFSAIRVQEYPPRLRALSLPLWISDEGARGYTKLLISEPNFSNKNSASKITFQSLGESGKDHVLIEILGAIIEQPFYEDLRTKQQLGYIVSSGLKGLGETRMLSLVVQSSIANASVLTSAIQKFISSFRQNTLEPMTKVEFGSFVKSLLDRKLEPDKKLAQEATRNWSEISSGRLQFNRIQLEAMALLDLTKEDLVEFWDDVITGRNSRSIVCEVVPKEGPASSKSPLIYTGNGNLTESSKNFLFKKDELILGIDDILSFRNSLSESQVNNDKLI